MTDRHGRGPPRLNILQKSTMGLGNMLMIRAAGKAVQWFPGRCLVGCRKTSAKEQQKTYLCDMPHRILRLCCLLLCLSLRSRFSSVFNPLNMEEIPIDILCTIYEKIYEKISQCITACFCHYASA